MEVVATGDGARWVSRTSSNEDEMKRLDQQERDRSHLNHEGQENRVSLGEVSWPLVPRIWTRGEFSLSWKITYDYIAITEHAPQKMRLIPNIPSRLAYYVCTQRHLEPPESNT